MSHESVIPRDCERGGGESDAAESAKRPGEIAGADLMRSNEHGQVWVQEVFQGIGHALERWVQVRRTAGRWPMQSYEIDILSD